MHLKQNYNFTILTDQMPVSQSRLGMSSSLSLYSPQSATFSSTFNLTIPRRKPMNGCLDAMKSSSPPCKQLSKDISLDSASVDVDAAYHNWVVIN